MSLSGTAAAAWARATTDPAYLAAVRSDAPTISGYVEVLDLRGQVLAVLGGPEATHPGVVSGEVSWSGDQDVAYDLSLDIDQDDLVPVDRGDLLHPLSYHLLRPWWSILTEDGWVHVPLATCVIESVTPVEDGSATVGLSVRAASVLGLVKRSLMSASAQVGGRRCGEAIQVVLGQAAPWLELTIDPSVDATALPAEYEAGEADADPVEVATDIATVAGAVITEDRLGGVRVGPPLPGGGLESLVEGPGCRATKVSTGIDLADIHNEVTVVSGAAEDAEGEDVEPVTVTVTDDDPSSPTWVGHGVRLRHATITLDEVVDEGQARTIALQRLAELSAATSPVVVECAPLPHVSGGDLVEARFPRVGVTGAWSVAGWSLRLGPEGGMRLNLGAVVDTVPAMPAPSRGGVDLTMPEVPVGRGMARLARSGRRGSGVHEAVVRVAPDPATGRAVVDLYGQETPVRVGPAMRGLAVGDRVTVTRSGGSWVSVAARSWRAPSPVAGTSTTPVAHNTNTDAMANNLRLRVNELLLTVESLRSALKSENIAREP